MIQGTDRRLQNNHGGINALGRCLLSYVSAWSIFHPSASQKKLSASTSPRLTYGGTWECVSAVRDRKSTGVVLEKKDIEKMSNVGSQTTPIRDEVHVWLCFWVGFFDPEWIWGEFAQQSAGSIGNGDTHAWIISVFPKLFNLQYTVWTFEKKEFKELLMVRCRRVIYCVYTLAFQSCKVHPCLLKRWNVPTNVARCERELGLPTLAQVSKWTV